MKYVVEINGVIDSLKGFERYHYDLSINKYKKTEYVAVVYPPMSEIMAKAGAFAVTDQRENASVERDAWMMRNLKN